MNLLFVGDVVGRPGRRAVAEWLPALRRELRTDFVVVNGENSAGGFGVTPETVRELRAAGADVVTGGNHIWNTREAPALLDGEPRLLRPANYPPGTPGRGAAVFEGGDGTRVAVLNLEGRIFMQPLLSPFEYAREEVERLRAETRVILVDMHAEATSEKAALAWHLDGRVSAVVGTHTHVQTADERILPGGTAFITDAGMTGPRDSIIGMSREGVLQRFLTLMPVRFEVADGPVQLNGVLIRVDPETGRASEIRRVNRLET
ncbi:MAG TPA: TIGR00282 family metallophosphoesterase [bacterium]|nr:TIGR00282 family metallophosphoesterase [bacterium]